MTDLTWDAVTDFLKRQTKGLPIGHSLKINILCGKEVGSARTGNLVHPVYEVGSEDEKRVFVTVESPSMRWIERELTEDQVRSLIAEAAEEDAARPDDEYKSTFHKLPLPKLTPKYIVATAEEARDLEEAPPLIVGTKEAFKPAAIH